MLDEIITALSSISSNLHGLFADFTSSPAFVCLDSDLTRLQRETETLCKNTEFLIGSQLHGTHQAMTELHSELRYLRQKYEDLQNEWASQQEHMGWMQAEIFKVRNQMQQQSQFCASLGSIMGNLIWKASRIPPVVDMLLSGNKVGDFLAIVNGSLISFMETYESSMPGQCADESQFIMSMCGIVTNIAAAPAGRQFLVSNPNGRELLEQFNRILPVIPAPSGNCLKRLLLMALYNTSINQNGLKFLQQQTDLLSAIAHDFQTDTTYELKLMELRLLQSLTYDIPNGKVLRDIMKEVPLELIQPLTQCPEPEMKNVVQEILNNLGRAQTIHKTKPSQGDLQQSRTKYTGECEEASPFGGTGMNKTIGGR
ncbi:heat shock factor 2-binding protein-like isoform X2 [Zootermopsis nevadensis]|uniref:heat shock factor 2-binding protein-like isoform X2 n=1 Tax=Zootermopsis nevadensis TaxID=136037 RepID=UPI000B8EBB6D|nr:heat shock factor 2-binding protein-like isoform X2 [Zootermopsis nevadensis]